jgi:outer membrane protein TolC
MAVVVCAADVVHGHPDKSPFDSRQTKSLRPARLAFVVGSALLLMACGVVQPKLATDPNALTPPTATKPWAPEEATRIPGGKDTLDAFFSRSAPSPALIQPGQVYDLLKLIDLAQQRNPETRAAWQGTRAAAARLGIAEGTYLPTLSAIGMASYAHLPDYDKMGPFLVGTGVLEPLLRLDWLLLDFGRRTAELDTAAQTLLAANLQFNRKQQSVIFAVQKGYYAFDASRARVAARETALKAATAVEQATGIRSHTGLASVTDTLLARQVVLQQQFDIDSARREVHAAEAQLAQAIGISPASLPEVVSLSSLPLPQGLPGSVDSLLKEAVFTRPDLAAKFADVRAREAELERARADYLPKLSVNGFLGRAYRELDSINLGPNGTTFYPKKTTAGIGLQLSWELFEGFIRDNRVREAKARRDQARADLDALQLATQAHVWTAYADFQSAISQHLFAIALVATTKSGYDSALTGYGSGITNFVDLLAAERDYARALALEVDTRAAILDSAAALAFAVGTSASQGYRWAPRSTSGASSNAISAVKNFPHSAPATSRSVGTTSTIKREAGNNTTVTVIVLVTPANETGGWPCAIQPTAK